MVVRGNAVLIDNQCIIDDKRRAGVRRKRKGRIVEKYYTVTELAQLAKCARHSVYRWCKNGEIKTIKISRPKSGRGRRSEIAIAHTEAVRVGLIKA